MEEEIDLRPWLFAILRRWQLVIGLAVIVAITTASIAFMRPRSRGAGVDVLIVPTSVQIALDQRFVNREASMVTTTLSQREALIGLATSSELAQRVSAQVGKAELTPSELQLLLNQITVTARGDLLRITAQDADADAALALAEAWAHGYERLVAEIYSRDALLTALIGEQISESQQRYLDEQAALEAFYAQDRRYERERQMRSLQGLIDGSIEAERTLYARYTQRAQELDLILQDAITLREQVRSGSNDDLASALSLLALRSRASGATELPVQLSLAESAELGGTPATLAELDALIVVLDEQRDRIADEARLIAEALTRGESGLIGTDTAATKRYQSQMTALMLETEQMRAKEQQLVQRRDTALASVDLLQRKLEEDRISALTPQVAVRMISSSVETQQSVRGLVLLYGGAGLLIGALVGVLAALALEIAGRRRRSSVVSTSTAPSPKGAVK